MKCLPLVWAILILACAALELVHVLHMTLIIPVLCPPIMVFLPFVWALLILYRPNNSDKRVVLVSRLVLLEAAVGATAAADVICVVRRVVILVTTS